MKINLKPLYNLNTREKLILGGVIMFIVGYVLYNIIVPPVIFHHRIARRQLGAQKKLMSTRKDKMERLIRLEGAFEKLKKDVLENRAKFFNEFTKEDALAFLNGLDSLAARTGIDLERINPKAVETLFSFEHEENVCYKVNIVEVILTGKYNNISRFLRKMLSTEKLLGITEVDMKHVNNAPGLLNMKFNLNVYTVGGNHVKN